MNGWAADDYELYVNGVLYKTPSILERGLPYFPVDVLSEATGVSVVSFSANSVKLAGSSLDFSPVIRKGRPYLPAEAFAMATGSGVEVDQTRGMVKYTKNVGQRPTAARGGANSAASRAGIGLPNANGTGGFSNGASVNTSGFNTTGIPNASVITNGLNTTGLPVNTNGPTQTAFQTLP